MPDCIECGAYTKYYNGRCSSCYYASNPKAGKVYFGEVTFPSGKKEIYTGRTKRSVYTRTGEHMRSQNSSNSNSYPSRGTSYRLLGSIASNNAPKAERTMKRKPAEIKIRVAKTGARNFRKRSGSFRI